MTMYISLRCCHFEMTASTAVSPPKKQGWLDECRCGAIKKISFFRAKRSAFATEKTNGQREGSRLSRALAKLDSHSEALRVSEAL